MPMLAFERESRAVPVDLALTSFAAQAQRRCVERLTPGTAIRLAATRSR